MSETDEARFDLGFAIFNASSVYPHLFDANNIITAAEGEKQVAEGAKTGYIWMTALQLGAAVLIGALVGYFGGTGVVNQIGVGLGVFATLLMLGGQVRGELFSRIRNREALETSEAVQLQMRLSAAGVISPLRIVALLRQLDAWQTVVRELQKRLDPALPLDSELKVQIRGHIRKFIEQKKLATDLARRIERDIRAVQAQKRYSVTPKDTAWGNEDWNVLLTHGLDGEIAWARKLLESANEQGNARTDGSLSLIDIPSECGALSLAEDTVGELDLIAKKDESRLPREPVESPEERRTKFRVLKDPEKE